ncbi:MAG: bacteriohemerythrin [Deltaproteobacteria bacterium]|jgi:hemerythrin|nr:bacteriohemerythrin [Deltaproteobacteria bacterium]
MITLTSDLETGVAKIDEQHRELVKRLNEAMTIGIKVFTTEETQKTIDFLGEYVIKHFNDEEALQRQSKYDKYEWHKGLHQEFIGEFKKLKDEFAANGPSAKFTVGLNTTLANWIVKHIKSVDVEFGKYYKEHAARK